MNFGVIIVTDNLIEGTDGELPIQTISFAYRQITESADTVVRSWDVSTARASGPAPQPGPDLAALPVPTGKVHLLLGGRSALSDVDLWSTLATSDLPRPPRALTLM